MDINDIRGFAAVLVLIAFLSICWWAFSPTRKQKFNDAANLPFADEDEHQRAHNADGRGKDRGNNTES